MTPNLLTILCSHIAQRAKTLDLRGKARDDMTVDFFCGAYATPSLPLQLKVTASTVSVTFNLQPPPYPSTATSNLGHPPPMQTLPELVQSFISSSFRQQWLRFSPDTGPGLHVYLRKGYHSIEGVAEKTLDLASVEIDNQAENTGLLRQLIEAMEQQTIYKILYFENHLSPRMREIAEKQKWNKIPNISDPENLTPCYWKATKNNHLPTSN